VFSTYVEKHVQTVEFQCGTSTSLRLVGQYTIIVYPFWHCPLFVLFIASDYFYLTTHRYARQNCNLNRHVTGRFSSSYSFDLCGGWAMEPVPFGIIQDPIGDISLEIPKAADGPIPESVVNDDNISLFN
jgi:hypothetical protein